MICVSTWPELATENSSLAKGVLHHGPASLGQVLGRVIEEIMVVDALLANIQLHVLLQEWLTEVNIIADFESLFSFQSFECLVLADFVQWSLLHSANWYYCAVRVNLVYNIRETVQLSDTIGWDFNLSPQEIVNVHEGGNAVALDNDFLEFSGENSLNMIKECLAGRSQ